MTTIDIAAPRFGRVIVDAKSAAPDHGSLERQRAEHLRGRLTTVLLDLGLDRVLTGWISVTEDGEVAFGPLGARTAEELGRTLEDVFADYRRPVARPGPGQLSLFETEGDRFETGDRR